MRSRKFGLRAMSFSVIGRAERSDIIALIGLPGEGIISSCWYKGW
jgi:hypothetical protein